VTGNGASPLPRSELLRTVLSVVFIGLLLAGSLWILRPFLGPLVWATMIVTASWPLLQRLQSLLWRRRAPAVAVMTLLLLLVFVVPLTLAIVAVVDQREEAAALVRTLSAMDLRKPPEWVAGLPLVGERVASAWVRLAATPVADLVNRATPYATEAAQWLFSHIGGVGVLVLQVLLTLVLASLMYASGEVAGRKLHAFSWRLAGERGMNAVTLASQAIRGVAIGVVGTAIIQSVLGGIGLAIAGIPAAAVLTGVMLVLCIAQLGPLLVLLPVTAWVYYSGDNVWGTFLLVWSLVVGTVDNIIRPVLIRRGADLPLLLILAGVIGGLLAFGLIGIFVGPVVLAVAYTLLDAWIEEDPGPAAPPKA
jgi:predicted PurR-regulated permease PerM